MKLKFSFYGSHSLSSALTLGRMSSLIDQLTTLLTVEFSPSHLELEQDGGECGAKITVHITSSKFKGMNRLKKSRAVNAVFKSFLDDGTVHALTIDAKDE